MATSEKRRFIRQDSLHLLDYLIIDHDGTESTYSMGRTLDVSIDGMKLETVHQLAIGTHLLITLGLEDNLVDIKGEVTHCKLQRGRYVSGITFLKITKSGRKIVAAYVEAFRKRLLEVPQHEKAHKN